MDYKVNKGMPFWPFDHKAVLNKFNGTRFINEFCIKDSYKPYAVYYAASPDVSKGHKPYFTLAMTGGIMYINGFMPEELEEWRYQDAIYCKKCKEVIYSKYRHDWMKCSCGNVGIDGGRDYTKLSFSLPDSYITGQIDLLEDKFIIKGARND